MATNSHPSFRVASKASEPGIHNHDWGLWIPGLRQAAHPGMTAFRDLRHPSRATSRGHLHRLRRGRLPVAQFVAREFADRRARQLVDEFDRGRNLVLAELAGEERL